MTNRRAGALVIVLGLAVAAWSWSGAWPWGGPAFSSGSDYVAINAVGVGVAIAGSLTTLMGVFVLVAGRGGPDDWDRR
jgi:hypothetical protein